MPTLRFDTQELQSDGSEKVLDLLLRNGIEVPSSCRSGVCQACMVRCVEGAPDPDSQKSLRASLRDKGYFLACQSKAKEGMAVTLGELTPVFQQAQLTASSSLSERVTELCLDLTKPLANASAGAFIGLQGPTGLLRSYSIAAITNDGLSLRLHVAHISGGTMSTWLCKQIRVGDSVTIRGPYGDCRYRGETREQNLLMIATGSGLAPVYGIAIDALTAQHRGQIHLYHGSRSEEGLYLQGKLEELSERHQNFHYTPTCSGPSSKVRHGRANDLAFADHPNLANWHVYLCGHPGMVSKSAMRAYLSGAQICDIYADPFEPASKPT